MACFSGWGCRFGLENHDPSFLSGGQELAVDCGFRRNPDTRSDSIRTPIPMNPNTPVGRLAK
jgi:hypothetical protein